MAEDNEIEIKVGKGTKAFRAVITFAFIANCILAYNDYNKRNENAGILSEIKTTMSQMNLTMTIMQYSVQTSKDAQADQKKEISDLRGDFEKFKDRFTNTTIRGIQ